MGDFYRRPLEKKMNKRNIISRIEAVERAQSAPPKMQAGSFEEIGQSLDLNKSTSVDSEGISSNLTDTALSYFTRPDMRVGMGWTIYSGAGTTNVVQGIGCDPVFGVTAPAAVALASQLIILKGVRSNIIVKNITYNAAANGAWVWPTAIIITPQLDPYFSCVFAAYASALSTTTIYVGITTGASATPTTGTYALFTFTGSTGAITFSSNMDGVTVSQTLVASGYIGVVYRAQIWIDNVNKVVRYQLDLWNDYLPNNWTGEINMPGVWSTTPGRAFCGCVVSGGVGQQMGFVRGYLEIG